VCERFSCFVRPLSALVFCSTPPPVRAHDPKAATSGCFWVKPTTQNPHKTHTPHHVLLRRLLPLPRRRPLPRLCGGRRRRRRSPPPSTHQRVHVAAAHGATVAASDESTARSPGAHRPLASRETPHAELTHPKGAAASAAARGRDAKAQGHTRREG
jgi:hypothetical protein